jgi:ubiquinone/menaquinone biosynthesis C-methylase UbiE
MNPLQKLTQVMQFRNSIYPLFVRFAPLSTTWLLGRLPFNDLNQYEELMRLSHPSFIWMNWGLDGADFSWLRAEDVEWKYQVNMARHNIRGLDLTGRRFLDTGSGRGGTCWFVKRYHAAEQVVGLDQSRAQVNWCRDRFRDSGIKFKLGDSQNIPFRPGSFDVVSNIESAPHYPDRQRFYREVYRVLSRSGYFCMSCNFRSPDSEERLIRSEGFELVDGTDITAGVVEALRKNDENLRSLLQRITNTEQTKQIGARLCSVLAQLPEVFLVDGMRYHSWIFQKRC